MCRPRDIPGLTRENGSRPRVMAAIILYRTSGRPIIGFFKTILEISIIGEGSYKLRTDSNYSNPFLTAP